MYRMVGKQRNNVRRFPREDNPAFFPAEQKKNMIRMYKKVTARNKKTALRSRKLNQVASAQLEKTVKNLSHKSDKVQRRHERQLQQIEQEITELQAERCYFEEKISLGRLSGCRLLSARKSQSGNGASSACVSPVSRALQIAERNEEKLSGGRWYPKRSKSSSKCNLYGCNGFPCRTPTTYHSIGLQAIYQDWQHKLRKTGDPDLQDVIPETPALGQRDVGYADPFSQPLSPSPKARVKCSYFGLPSPRDRLRDREDKLLAGMRGRDKVRRPEAWCTNYGKPVSQRRLLKPVVPMSAN